MRIFLAVNFPPSLRRRAWESAAPLRDRDYPVRWVGADLIHLTMKFLGEVSADRLPEVELALREAVAGTRVFELPVGTFGAFPNPRNPRVVWIGCEAVPPLELLQDRVERAMARVGYPVEGRPFRPHLTLGRARKDAHRRDWDGFGQALDTLEFHDVSSVTSIDIMESTLRPAGAEYRVNTSVNLEA